MTRYLAAFAVFSAAACFGPPPVDTRPTVAAISKDEIQVGETLWFTGTNFVPPGEGKTTLTFEGAFYWTADDGRQVSEEVAPFTIAPVFDGLFPDGGRIADVPIAPGHAALRWNRFGPYAGPFGGGGNHPGLFKGTVTPINVRGEQQEVGEPTPIAMAVRPSVLVRRLEPIIGETDTGEAKLAECKYPALRVFGGMPYVLEVEAMGFTPAYFIYEIAGINGSQEWTTFTHQATAMSDRLGDPAMNDAEILMFNPIPDDVDSAIASIRVTAVDAENRSVATALPVPVVRPLRFNYDGNRELAQYYEPVPVHGPIVGGIGTEVTYAESQSESRMTGVSVTFTKSVVETIGSEQTETWNDGYSTSTSTSNTVGTDTSTSEAESSEESYGVDYSSETSNSIELGSTTGTEWGWSTVTGTSSESYQDQMNHLFGSTNASLNTEVGGEASIPGLATVSGKVGTTVGTNTEQGVENTSGTRTGQSNETGTSMSTSDSTSEVFGSVTTDGRSQSMSGSYGVERQSTINNSSSQTDAKEESVSYDIGGSTSVNSSYSVGSEEAWSQNWESTETQENLLEFSGRVPNNRCAMIYRQTVRYVRTAKIEQYDLCGVSSTAAELTFNEWSWSPNIAIGEDCTTGLPESTLPKAECFLACE